MLCTQVRASDGSWNVSTIEHLMSALTAARIHNARVDILEHEGGNVVEIPILDGSALPFAQHIQQAGVAEIPSASQRYVRILRPVQVLLKDKAAWFLPLPDVDGAVKQCAPTLHVSVQVNFAHKGLGTVHSRFTLGADSDASFQEFMQSIAPARTFTFEEEVAWMQQNGLALGGSLDNAVVFKASKDGDAVPHLLDRVMNPEGLRFADDEWARHKLLDCVGDVGLLGLPVHGYLFSTSPGHALTHRLLEELLSDPHNYEIVSTTV
ncbi:hypothetical protein PINS_up005771 [Pythium insidiosum]|nr:hypothetical protein PINS_up005771 [Pythium insidiosum]